MCICDIYVFANLCISVAITIITNIIVIIISIAITISSLVAIVVILISATCPRASLRGFVVLELVRAVRNFWEGLGLGLGTTLRVLTKLGNLKM